MLFHAPENRGDKARGLRWGSVDTEANSLDGSCKGAMQELRGDGCNPGSLMEVKSLKRD